MRNTIKKNSPLWLIGGLCLLAAGCSSDDNNASEIDNTGDVSFSISADGSQEIPAKQSMATASGRFVLDPESGALSGEITTTGMTATAAHIHEGVAGSNGGVIIALDVNGSTINVPETTVLTSDQIVSMMKADYYVNIHSELVTSGEIRDQLTREGVEDIQVALSGSNEVPAVSSTGSGTGYVTLDTSSGAMTVNVITSDLITPQAAHLHTGAAGANGGVLLPLTQDVAEVGNFSASVETQTEAEISNILSGGTYLNIHTAENPSGELRGQIQP